MSKKPVKHFVYMVRCRDGSLYCGQTPDLENRIREHNEGKNGAAYTRSRRPVALVYFEMRRSLGGALRREWAIKQLTRKQKEELILEWKPGLKPI